MNPLLPPKRLSRQILLLLFALLLSLPGLAAEPQPPAAIALAKEYMAALTRRDYRTLARFYHRDTLFSDRRAGKTIKGRRAILAFLRQVHTYTEEFAFNIDHQFYKGSRVVMIGNYYYRARGDLFGFPGESITFTLPGVTILKLDKTKNRIDEHLDLLDYATMTEQLSNHPSLRVR